MPAAKVLPPLPALALLAALPAALLSAPRPGEADVVTTVSGLTLEGAVEKQPDGSLAVTTDAGRTLVAAKDVAAHAPGDGPRTTWRKEVAAAAPADAAAWYRLALRAEGLKLTAEAREAHGNVLAASPDHAASRRALGHEKVDGAWLPADEARRRRGFVLFAGEWRLPEEVEAAQAAGTAPRVPAPGTDDARLRALVRDAGSADPVRAEAARRAMASAPTKDLVAAALGVLGDADAAARAAACRLLGEWGDESALRALVFRGARDLDEDVRREAVLAAASFGHDDTAVPFVKALGSDNLRLVANAAQAIGLLGDQRAAGYVVKRLESHGSGSRSFVAFLHQVSYVRDYDVEIAQASNIANPNIGLIQEGTVLDVHVKGTEYTATWIEPILVGALGRLAGERFGSAAEARAWYAANKERLGDFPKKPAARAPRRGEGKTIGFPPESR